MKNDIAMVKAENTFACKLAKLKAGVSSLSQRVVLSGFLEDAMPVLLHLKTLTPIERTALVPKHGKPKMKSVNAVLRSHWPEVGQGLLPSYTCIGHQLHNERVQSFSGIYISEC